MKKNIIAGILAITAASAHAAVVTNPTLITGANSIDPIGGRNDLNLTASNAATKAALEAVANFGVMQGPWTGLTASTGTTPTATSTNIFTFTDRPDVSFTFVGEPGRNTNSGTGTAAAYTSGPTTPVGGESLFFGTSSSNVLTIEFGAYDSINQTFSANSGVIAAGFTFSRNTAATVDTIWNVSFFDGATLLSAQNIGAGQAQNVAGLFGYIAQPGEEITRIVVGGGTSFYNDKNHFIDDFGFAVVPEPSAALLSSLGLLALLSRHRRV